MEKASEIFDNNYQKRHEELDNDRYIKIPHLSIPQIYEWMKEYTDEFINREDPDFAKKVYEILKTKKSFERFKDLLEQSNEGWIHGWVQWKQDLIYEEMQSWFSSLSIKIIEECEWLDDCLICQEMKKAEEENRTLTEKGGVVEILNKDKASKGKIVN